MEIERCNIRNSLWILSFTHFLYFATQLLRWKRARRLGRKVHPSPFYSFTSKIELDEIIWFRFLDKRLQKERGSISKAWSYPERAVFYLKCLYTHTRAHTYVHPLIHTYIYIYTYASIASPRGSRENTDDRSRCDEVFDLNLFTSLLCLYAMPGFLDISPHRMACALLSLPPSHYYFFLIFFNLAMRHADPHRRCSHSIHDVPV